MLIDILVLIRTSSGQVVLLQDKKTYKMFVVINCFACGEESPGYNELKVNQIILLLATLEKYRGRCPDQFYGGSFLAGSFGFEPYSPLFNFITDGCLDFVKNHIDNVTRAYDLHPVKSNKCRPSFTIPEELGVFAWNCTFLNADHTRRI